MKSNGLTITTSKKTFTDVLKEFQVNRHDVLVLTSKDPKYFMKFVRKADTMPDHINFSIANYSDLEFSLGTAINQVSLGGRGRDLDSYDLVVFKDYLKDEEVAVSAAVYLSNRGRPFIDRALGHIILTDKLFQYEVLSDLKIPIPKTIYMSITRLRTSYDDLVDQLGLPFILKNIFSNKGRDNFLVSSPAEYKSVLEGIGPNEKYVTQEYIDNDCDYRLFIMGNKIQLVIRRSRGSAKTHLNNVSVGGEAKTVSINQIPLSVQKQSLEAAAILKRDIAGVDVVRNKTTGLWCCFEVNDGPQLISGAFVDKKRQAFFDYIDSELAK